MQTQKAKKKWQRGRLIIMVRRVTSQFWSTSVYRDEVDLPQMVSPQNTVGRVIRT